MARNVAYGLGSADASAFQWKKLALLAGHTLGAVAHLVGIVVTCTQTRWNIKLRTFDTNLVNSATDGTLQLSRQIAHVGDVYPSHVVAAFFSLSFGFHAVLALVLLTSLFSDHVLVRWYMAGLDANVAPTRWVEYFFSASIMMLLACMLLGLRDIPVLYAVVAAMAITQTFGLLTEVHSSFFIEDGPPRRFCRCAMLKRRWVPRSWRHRLLFHFLGYAPYVLSWYLLMQRWSANMAEVAGAVPYFVSYVVVSSAAVFTLFGLVQLALQTYSYGPSLFWLGELVYVILSFVAKANLGFVIVYMALVEGALYDQLLGVAT